jgi:hypothetical protein
MATTLLASSLFKMGKLLFCTERLGTCIHTLKSSLEVCDPKGLNPCGAH